MKRIDKLIDGLKALATAEGGTSSGSSAKEGGNDDKIDPELMTSLTTALRAFEEAMCDDMNTPR